MSIKMIILFTSIAACSCCSSTHNGKNNPSPGQDSLTNTTNNKNESLPRCMVNLIDQFNREERQSPPRSVYSYTYKGKKVYYVPAICCDFYSDLYDSNCTIIGHPDGGYTGRGDGQITDFKENRSAEKLLWKDERP